MFVENENTKVADLTLSQINKLNKMTMCISEKWHSGVTVFHYKMLCPICNQAEKLYMLTYKDNMGR